MSRIKFITTVLSLFSASVLAQVSDPADHTGSSATCDVKHIALDLRFDWEKKQAFGTATISFSPTTSTNQITLDSGQLSIESVTDQQRDRLDFIVTEPDGEDNLRINFSKTLQPDEELTLQIKYRTNHVNRADPNNLWGSFGKGLRFHQPTSTTPNKRQQVWASGEPDGSRYWFPCNNDPADLRTTEIKATVEQAFTVVANGDLLSRKSSSDGTHTFHFKSKSPYQNHLTSIVVGEYEPVRQSWDDLELLTYGYADEKEAVEATVERLPEMIEFFSEQTGQRYPYSRYSQIVVQDYPFPGRTGQHMVPIMSDNMIDDFRVHADFLYLWDIVESQSLASQWYGNLIAIRNWKHLWLSQGFSRYFAGRFNIKANGRDEFLTYQIGFDMGAVIGAWNSGNRHPLVPENIDDLDQFTYDGYASQRGALVLRMLENELGEETWLRVVQHYVKTNAGKLVSTANLQDAIEHETGDRLDWFFQQWVFGMGHPVFEIATRFDTEKKHLQLTVKQVQKPETESMHPQAEFFQGKLNVAIDGKLKTIRLEPQAMNTFEFELANVPKLVNFDHRDVWIKEVTFEKSLDDLIYQLQHDKDVRGQGFAMRQLIKLAQADDCSKSEKRQIVTALRDMIDGESYWRIRAFAVSQLSNLLANDDANLPLVLEPSIEKVLLKATRDNAAWLRTAAISTLGKTRNPKFVETYIASLVDKSDRVINAAATALGQTKDPRAFEALVKLKDKQSWKSQSLVSTLNGLRELGDPRGYEIALEALSDKTLPRWWLASPTWDYPIPAVHTIVALGKGDTVFPMLLERFEKSLDDQDYNDIFSNVLLISELGDPRGQQVFELLKKQFASDANAMNAIDQFESTYKNNVKKNMKTEAHSNEITSAWQTKEARQFDFWIGKWDVNLRAIQKDLTWNNTTKATVEIYPVLDGKAILELWDSPTIKGFSLRYFDPVKGKWVLYLNWPNEKESSFSSLEGAFRHGRGEFFAKNDGTISRYTFCDVSPTSLRWDDAYSKDGGKTWTYDWIMEFSRTAAIPTWPSSSLDAHTFAKVGTRCRGNDAEFAKIASVAGQWKGEVVLVEEGKNPIKSVATARAYRILDGCAMILFLEHRHASKSFRTFSMLTYNSTRKRFEELRLDNRQGSVAAVLCGHLSDDDLILSADGDSTLKSVWQFPSSEGDLQIDVHQTASGMKTQHTYVLQKVPLKDCPKEAELHLADAINAICPRSGKPVVSNSLTTYRGFTVGFCNQHCRDDFATDMENCDLERRFFDDIIEQKK